jgi:hypothetical protein
MEYVILIVVLAVLAVVAGGWLLLVRPRRGRTLEAPRPQAPVPPVTKPPTGPGGGEGETAAVP